MLKLSAEVNEIVEFSKVISKNFGHSFVGTEHLLLALMGRKSSEEYIRTNVPGASNVGYSLLMNEIISRNGQGERCEGGDKLLSANYKKVLSKGYINAFSRKSSVVDVEDIVKALFNDNVCSAVEIFELCKENHSTDSGTVKTFSLNKERLMAMRKETPVLNSFSRDVTLEALEDKLDPVIERDAEMDRVIRVLLRKNKNNPCLVGSAGVGKTAIADGIAMRIVNGTVPYELSQKRIVALDIALLLAGAKYRGDFEERLKSVFEEVKKCKDVILLVDEIHNIVNTGNGEGTLDAANILKPELARGDVSIIGATTAEEYTKTIEKDSALDRRFQRIEINEPSLESTVKILQGLKPRYESFHNIKIEDDAIKNAIRISVKEIHNRYLPDKAIDLIDEASAFIRLEGRCKLTAEDVLTSFTRSYKQKSMSKEELSSALKSKLIGQEAAVDKVSDLIEGRKGIFSDGKLLSMLFVGPTGCGKSALAELVSKLLFGENSLLKIDMGEYTEKHSLSKLIGAPPGYVGYQDNGLLVNAIIEKQSRVILLDDIEKAHSDVIKALTSIIDEGTFKNTIGRTVSFQNCIFILTTSIGCGKDSISAGFSPIEKVNRSDFLDSTIGKEILARIDESVCFEKANVISARKICCSLIEPYRNVCFENKISLSVDDDVIEDVINRAELDKFGYRNLKKLLSNTVVKELRKAWSKKDKGLRKIRIYKKDSNEITHFPEFKEFAIENKKLSMYNN